MRTIGTRWPCELRVRCRVRLRATRFRGPGASKRFRTNRDEPRNYDEAPWRKTRINLGKLLIELS